MMAISAATTTIVSWNSARSAAERLVSTCVNSSVGLNRGGRAIATSVSKDSGMRKVT